MERIKLELVPGGCKPIIHASQYDIGRQWWIELLNNGVPYVLQEGDTVEYAIRKGDGLVVTGSIAFTPDATYVILVSTEQMCAIYGSNLGELKISSNGAEIGTGNFILDVEKMPEGGDKRSQSEIYDLQSQVDACTQKALANIGAKGLPFDNEDTDLEATNTEDAIKEVDAKVDGKADSDSVYTKEEVNQIIDALPDPMVFKGTLGVGGTIQTLPAASAENEGWMFKCITTGTYAGLNLQVGDTVTCFNPPNTSTYYWDKTGSQDTDTDTWRAIKVNGTEKLSNGTSSGAVDFVEGDNINITFDSNGNKIEVEADIIDDTKALTTKAWSGSKVNGLAIPNHKTDTSLFVGNGSGDNNTESGGDNGKYNTALGVNASRDNTTGDHNTALGFQTMQYNQTGNGNTAVGEDALYSNVSGNGNTAVGVHALQKATGASNVAVGQSALIDQTSGFFNTAIGNEAGKGSGVPITTDHGLTLIGNRTGKNPSTEVENSTAIGYYARVDKSNQIVLGNTSVTELVFGNYVIEFNEDHTVTWRSRTQ